MCELAHKCETPPPRAGLFADRLIFTPPTLVSVTPSLALIPNCSDFEEDGQNRDENGVGITKNEFLSQALFFIVTNLTCLVEGRHYRRGGEGKEEEWEGEGVRERKADWYGLVCSWCKLPTASNHISRRRPHSMLPCRVVVWGCSDVFGVLGSASASLLGLEMSFVRGCEGVLLADAVKCLRTARTCKRMSRVAEAMIAMRGRTPAPTPEQPREQCRLSCGSRVQAQNRLRSHFRLTEDSWPRGVLSLDDSRDVFRQSVARTTAQQLYVKPSLSLLFSSCNAHFQRGQDASALLSALQCELDHLATITLIGSIGAFDVVSRQHFRKCRCCTVCRQLACLKKKQ